ncbi:hypothetical protein H2201_008776 [Coniosporium apollinis]|uniref:Uncharacterized protein n=1 Tax=Coniosporium apollinis TaxID=61459 RepID=A0ABQ9NIV5_9PEZI|nr:hypothetical protein H2201_008776 [Coniosporium apollinis]
MTQQESNWAENLADQPTNRPTRANRIGLTENQSVTHTHTAKLLLVMEVDDVGESAGSVGTAPPARSTRAQQRKVAKETNSKILGGRGHDIDQKLDFILRTILNLNHAVKQLQEGQDEMRKQNEEMRKEIDELRKQNDNEVRKLQEQITNLSTQNSPQSSSGTSPGRTNVNNRSWSSLFAGQSSVSPNSSASQPRVADPNQLLGVNIDLSRCSSQIPTDTAEIKRLVTIALHAYQATKEVNPTAIIKTNRDLHRIRVIVRSEKEAELIRSQPQWLETHFRGGRLRGEQWYPIKVDRVDKLKIMNEEQTGIRAGLEKKLSQENKVTIMRITTLGKLATHKLYCSIIVYLKKKEDAE